MLKRFYENMEKENIWKGRIDDPNDRDSFRWHQVVERIHLDQLEKIRISTDEFGICFIGFCCDAGIELNLGRVGASKGPRAIREQMCNLPFNFEDNIKIYDIGNIVCTKNSDLQEAQLALAELAPVMSSSLSHD